MPMQIVDFLYIDTKEITFKEPKPNKYNGSQNWHITQGTNNVCKI